MAIPSILRHLAFVLLAQPLAVHAQESKPMLIRFQLVDSGGNSMAGTPTRLVLASGNDWQSPSAGFRTITGDAGKVHWSTDAVPERGRRKFPTNFFTQLMAPVEDTHHVSVGAELTYAGHAWLVVASADLFENGATVQFDGLKVYGQDAAGRFTLPVIQKAGAWHFPGVAGALTTQGFSVQRFAIAPGAQGWTVDLVLRKDHEPVVR